MLSKLLNKKKNWFTLIELLLVCSAFAILVSGVIIAINRAYSFMNDTKVRVRASNFAREWVEIIFNMRDTNWRRHSWERDANWLDTWTWSNIFGKWLYVLKEWITPAGDKYFYADRLDFNTIEDVEKIYNDFFNGDVPPWTEMQFEWDYSYMEYSGGNRVPQTWSIQELLTNETKFYRIVRVFGIYNKLGSSPDIEAISENHKDGTPAEMRFCVKVFYMNGGTRGSSELCSIMTNFME